MKSAASNVGGSGARPNESGPELDAATVRFHRFGWRIWVRVFGRWWGLCW